MAENQNGELFKVVKKGGYDREDVEQQFSALKQAAAMEKQQLEEQIAERDAQIASLNETVAAQRDELDTLRRNISEKYQSYIDNYDTIGQVILDSRVQAKKIVEEAYAEKDRILLNANQEVEKAAEEARQQALADSVHEKEEIEKATEEKKRAYESVCARLNALLADLDATQLRLDDTIRSMHEVAEGIIPAGGLDDLDTADTQEFDFQKLSSDL